MINQRIKERKKEKMIVRETQHSMDGLTVIFIRYLWME